MAMRIRIFISGRIIFKLSRTWSSCHFLYELLSIMVRNGKKKLKEYKYFDAVVDYRKDTDKL